MLLSPFLGNAQIRILYNFVRIFRIITSHLPLLTGFCKNLRLFSLFSSCKNPDAYHPAPLCNHFLQKFRPLRISSPRINAKIKYFKSAFHSSLPQFPVIKACSLLPVPASRLRLNSMDLLLGSLRSSVGSQARPLWMHLPVRDSHQARPPGSRPPVVSLLPKHSQRAPRTSAVGCRLAARGHCQAEP